MSHNNLTFRSNQDLCEVELSATSQTNKDDPTVTDNIDTPYYMTYYRTEMTVRNEISRFLQQNTFGPTKEELDALEARYNTLRGSDYVPPEYTWEEFTPVLPSGVLEDLGELCDSGNVTDLCDQLEEIHNASVIAWEEEAMWLSTPAPTLAPSVTSGPSYSPTITPAPSGLPSGSSSPTSSLEPTSVPSSSSEPSAPGLPSSLPSSEPSQIDETETTATSRRRLQESEQSSSTNSTSRSHAEAMAALQLEWVTNQMDPSTFSSGEFTSLRKYWRRRLNARKTESYRIGESGPHACEKYSRWRKFAFTKADVEFAMDLRWGSQELGGTKQKRDGHLITIQMVVRLLSRFVLDLWLSTREQLTSCVNSSQAIPWRSDSWLLENYRCASDCRQCIYDRGPCCSLDFTNIFTGRLNTFALHFFITNRHFCTDIAWIIQHSEI